jgi:outer membrane protein assembly factor BamB
VALDKNTGAEVWATGKDAAGYASVIPFTAAGRPALLVFKAEAMVAKSARDGGELWRIPWKSAYDVNASSPFVDGNRLFISSGYAGGRAAVFNLAGAQPSKVWQNDELKTKMSSAAFHQGHAYGVTEKGGKTLCLSLTDGRTKWKGDAGGQFGNLVVVNGTLVILADDGELTLSPADPAGFKAGQSAKILSGRCWVQPVVANGFLLAKNNKGATVCLDMRK